MVKLEEKIKAKMLQAIADGEIYSTPDKGSGDVRYSSDKQKADVAGWAVSVVNLMEIIFPGKKSAYFSSVVEAAGVDSASTRARKITAILKNFRKDLDDGLIVSITNLVTAENFDDFLAHAEFYIKSKQKMESGVIVGMVFEDTIRKICEKHGISHREKKLDTIISALKTQNIITKARAANCRAGAALRGDAGHANWDEFELADVKQVISMTRELIEEHLEK
ncbi:MAG: hypothetical protein WBK77_09725 [Alphaproteobacteria bacterium]